MSDIESTESSHLTFQAKKAPQIIAAFTASLGAFSLGNVVGWSSVGIPGMEKTEDFTELTKEEKTWIASLATIGAVFAAFFAGWALEKFGRKMTILMMAPPFTLGWILLALASSVNIVYLGRFITGFCGGVYPLVVSLYVGETAESAIRGRLGNGMVLFLVTGVFSTYLMGTFISYVWLSLICGGIPLLLLFLFAPIPESPRYLLAKGKTDEARRALKWLRGAEFLDQIEQEMKSIMVTVEENSRRKASFKDLFARSSLKPIAICLGLMMCQQFGGINVVLFYTVDIFESAGTDIDSNLATIIVGFTQIVAVFVSILLVDLAGRKILLVASEAGLVVSLGALGAFFYLKEQNGDESPEGLGWLPLTSLLVYIVAFNLALSPIPWLMLGELIPSHILGPASSLASAFSWFLAFLMTKSFEDLNAALGIYGCYWMFAAISFLGGIFSLFIVPETKGKSLDEIQKLIGN